MMNDIKAIHGRESGSSAIERVDCSCSYCALHALPQAHARAVASGSADC